MDDRTVLGRAVLIVDAVTTAGEPISLARLTEHTALPKATVRRIANDLARRGLLSASEGGYSLGPYLHRLGLDALEGQPLRQAATPHLQDLFSRTGEVVFLAQVLGEHLRTVEQVFGRRRVDELQREPRWLAPLADPEMLCTAAGRVVLVQRPDLLDDLARTEWRRRTRYSPVNRRQLTHRLDQVRETGIAIECEEFTLGWCCISAPIYAPDGTVTGVVGVSGRTGTLHPERWVRPVTNAADQIAQAAARTPASRPRGDRSVVAPVRE